jgi:hypothetical protein
MVRGLVRVVLVTSVVLAALAALVLSPDSFRGFLPNSLLDSIARLDPGANPPAPVALSGDSPADFLSDGPDGLQANGPIAALAGNQPVFISDVVTGYTTSVGADIPVEITTLRPIMGCLLTPPLPETVVGNVVAGESDLALGFLTYSDTDLAAAVQVFVDDYRQHDEAQPVLPEALAYQSYDVVVTEAVAPVYLVLQTGPGNRIWNIHAAPGARIERVVLLGGGQAGVANLDPVVPVEALLDTGLQACGIRPAWSPTAGQIAASASLPDTSAAVAAYDQWFRDSFGGLAEATRSGFDRGTVSVVGPVPGDEDPAVTVKATFAPIVGAKIRTTQDSFFEIRGQVPPGEDFSARVKAIATSFAFGDLANLRQGADF